MKQNEECPAAACLAMLQEFANCNDIVFDSTVEGQIDIYDLRADSKWLGTLSWCWSENKYTLTTHSGE